MRNSTGIQYSLLHMRFVATHHKHWANIRFTSTRCCHMCVPQRDTISLLRPTGNCITRFNVQKLYIVITWNLRVLYVSLNKQQILPYKTLKDWFL